jgi:hypothetical protein
MESGLNAEKKTLIGWCAMSKEQTVVLVISGVFMTIIAGIVMLLLELAALRGF